MTDKSEKSYEAKVREAASDFYDMILYSVVMKWEYIEAFKAGAAWSEANPSPRVLELVEALDRLTKVGPPSVPTTGEEWASQCLKNNCEIAREALAKFNRDGVV